MSNPKPEDDKNLQEVEGEINDLVDKLPPAESIEDDDADKLLSLYSQRAALKTEG